MSRRYTIPDPFRFAAVQGEAAGALLIADSERLIGMLHDTSGEIAWQVRGERKAEGRSFLHFELSGNAGLTCQRCLGRLDWRVAVQPVLRLVAEDSEIPDDELEIEEYDTIEATRDLDVVALVEDELLLAMPIAPMHETCESPHPAGATADESPFAVLAKLRQRP